MPRSLADQRQLCLGRFSCEAHVTLDDYVTADASFPSNDTRLHINVGLQSGKMTVRAMEQLSRLQTVVSAQSEPYMRVRE